MTTELEIIRGDDVTISATITDKDGNAVDLTGAKAYLTVKNERSDSDDDALIQKTTEVHSEATDGETGFDLTDEDTDIAEGKYYYDLQIKDSDGKIRSVGYGTIKVIQDITKTIN